MGTHLEKLKQFMYKVPPTNKLEAKIFEHMTQTISKAERNAYNLPFIVSQLPELMNKNNKEYTEYLNDYLDLSKEKEKAILTPYKETAIEDLQGIVLFDSIDKDSFNVLSFNYDNEKNSHLNFSNINILSNFNNKLILGEIIPGYGAILSDKGYYKINFNDKNQFSLFVYNILNATTKGIEKLAYITDPNNSLISEKKIEEVKKKSYNSKKNDEEFIKMLKLMEEQYGKHNLN